MTRVTIATPANHLDDTRNLVAVVGMTGRQALAAMGLQDIPVDL